MNVYMGAMVGISMNCVWMFCAGITSEIKEWEGHSSESATEEYCTGL